MDDDPDVVSVVVSGQFLDNPPRLSAVVAQQLEKDLQLYACRRGSGAEDDTKRPRGYGHQGGTVITARSTEQQSQPEDQRCLRQHADTGAVTPWSVALD